MPQEPQVVLEEQPDVLDLVAQDRHALDAEFVQHLVHEGHEFVRQRARVYFQHFLGVDVLDDQVDATSTFNRRWIRSFALALNGDATRYGEAIEAEGIMRGGDALHPSGTATVVPDEPDAGLHYETVTAGLAPNALAMVLRFTIAQPFRIPSGSMQPTLYGVHFEDLTRTPEARVPMKFMVPIRASMFTAVP